MKMTGKIIAAAAAALLLCPGCGSAKDANWTVEVVREYPHDTKSYTQGLFFNDGQLYESTGQWGESTFRIVDLQSGGSLRKLDYARKYFIEGSVMLNGKLYVLTWTNKVAFIYDASTLEYLQTYSYPREGWGLTTDGKSLIASDGSDRIYWLSEDFRLEKSIKVTRNGKPLKYLNELEWIDGKIWANIYTTDYIAIIDPQSGNVERLLDCSNLIPAAKRTNEMDVLNGIAFDPGTGKIYLTGKYWPKLFEIRIKK